VLRDTPGKIIRGEEKKKKGPQGVTVVPMKTLGWADGGGKADRGWKKGRAGTKGEYRGGGEVDLALEGVPLGHPWDKNPGEGKSAW